MAVTHRFKPRGVETSVWHGKGSNVDLGGEPWGSSCDTHGSLIGNSTQRGAILSAQYPENFCEDCREELHSQSNSGKEEN